MDVVHRLVYSDNLERMQESVKCTFDTMPGGHVFEEFLDFMYKLGEQDEVE